ncbi:GFA family protein [Ramlibacter albus]|uniref:GFA family protein n=1 Tax=Ramlibacter albus TaxID=2079448 RepID=A0A923MEH6_9BURK|nr:GFA family protein [Ramlibacter albus]MBC5767964.1 GFA family protein [Ramlibacter albus]
MHIDGTCHCGSISFTAEIDPQGVTVCHCTDCQVMSGAPFRTVVEVPITQFTLRGEPKRYATLQHGKPWVQAFCPECGTPIFAAAAESPSSVVIRLGCVTQRAQLRPHAQLWRNLALPWLAELPSIPDMNLVSGPTPVD